MHYNLAPNEPFQIKRGNVTVEVPLTESGNLATDSSLSYTISDATTSISGTILTAVMNNRTINKVSVPDGMIEVVVRFPDETTGYSRDFILILSCGTPPPSISYGGYNIILSKDNADLDPESGSNVYSFTEISRNQFLVSRIILTSQSDNSPTNLESLIQAMESFGYDTSSIRNLPDACRALNLPETATVKDCVQKLLYS